MRELIPLALFGWPAVVLVMFSLLPPLRAVTLAYVFGWLFLPVAGYNIEGLPPYEKVTATSLSVVVCSVAFHARIMFGWRLSVWDVPVLVVLGSPFLTSVVEGKGAYDGASAVLQQVVTWGLPYWVGRAYFRDTASLKVLATGVVIGGLAYAPLCAWELVMSPRLHYIIFDVRQHAFGQTMRMGGWRPMVFLQHGLACSLYMCAAALAAVWLWRSGAGLRLLGVPMLWLAAALVVVAVACKSLLAILLLFAGAMALWTARWTRVAVMAAGLIAVPPMYVLSRASGVWDGGSLVGWVGAAGDRAVESVETRIRSENALLDHALKKPVLGYSRSGAVPRGNHDRRIAVPDGLWILTLARSGFVGLGSLLAMVLLPAAGVVWRVSGRLWGTPAGGVPALCAVSLSLFMIDSLFNAMLNPIYVLIVGGLTTWVASRHVPGMSARVLGARRGEPAGDRLRGGLA